MTSGEPSPGTAAGPPAIRRCFGLLLVVLTATLAVVAGVFSPAPAPVAVAHYDTVAYTYDAPARLSSPDSVARDAWVSTSGPEVGSWVSPVSVRGDVVAAKGGGALVKYDADFAIGQLTKGGRGTASGLVDLAESQGWKAVQSSGGPLKYFDSNGIERLVIKRGSARTPGSDFPHVAIRNASGQRVDPYGNLVTRKSPGNHTPITWDLP